MTGRTKLLIVEDDPEIRRLLAIGLNQRGFEVKLAANGAEAVERIACERPDVVLLDWVMPLMNGAEVLKKLSDGESSEVPIIVVSGQPPPRGKRDRRILRWLRKPVSLDELVAEIQRPLPVY